MSGKKKRQSQNAQIIIVNIIKYNIPYNLRADVPINIGFLLEVMCILINVFFWDTHFVLRKV